MPAAGVLPPNLTLASGLAGLSLFRGGDGAPATAGQPTNLSVPVQLFIPLLPVPAGGTGSAALHPQRLR